METRNETQWFCNGYHCLSGRPVMEDQIMEKAKTLLLHRTIYSDQFKEALKELNEAQDRIRKNNKRLKPVDIHFSTDRGYCEDLRWLYIGQQHLTFQMIKGEY